MQRFESVLAVIVVRIDDGEGTVQDVLAAENRVRRAPGLFTLGWRNVACGQLCVQLLEYVVYLHMLCDAVADRGAEILFNVVVDDENDPLKARFHRIKEGIINDDLSVSAHGIDLLQTAVARAHAGSHDDKRRFFHGTFLLQDQMAICLSYLKFIPHYTPYRRPWQERARTKRGGTAARRER